MIYQCTQELLKQLERAPVHKPDPMDPLYAWNVKSMKIGRRKLIYLMNDASKLSLVFYGVRKKEMNRLDEIVREALATALSDCRIAEDLIAPYIADAGEPIYTKSGTRQQLGVLNRSALELEYFFDDFMEEGLFQRQLSQHLNTCLYKDDHGGFVEPDEAMAHLLMRTIQVDGKAYDLGEIALHMFSGDRFGYGPFLHVPTGEICEVETNSEAFEDFDLDDAYSCIPRKFLDFWGTFQRFASGVEDPTFLEKLKHLGHGRGAVKRIKGLLEAYPTIESKWFDYRDQIEKELVADWLRSKGLME